MSAAIDEEKIEDLLRRCAAHDQAALAVLYNCVASQLLALLVRMLGTRAAAEDVLQEAFIRIWQEARQFDRIKGRAMAWIVSIARNRAIDVMRRSRPLLVLDAAELADNEELRSPSAGDGAEFETAQAALSRCLKLLDSTQQRCFILAYQHGMTQDEIAQSVAQPLGTVKSWLRRGLQSLKQCIES